MTKPTLQAVIFDFDGVVVKSMEQHFAAWQKAFAEKNIHIKADDFFILEGQGVRIIAHALGKEHGLSEREVEEIIQRKMTFYNQFMYLEFYDHFKEMLKNLHRHRIPLGVVTGGNRERVWKVINEHFPHDFKAVVTVDDVERGKPHPDPFLKGAELLGVKAQDCIVVENAPLGIKGAKKAGMRVIAVTTTLPAEKLRHADYIAKDFREVETIILSLF